MDGLQGVFVAEPPDPSPAVIYEDDEVQLRDSQRDSLLRVPVDAQLLKALQG